MELVAINYRINFQVSVLEEEKRTEQTEREKLFELVKQLQTDNEHLNEQVKEFNDKTNSEANASEDDEVMSLKSFFHWVMHTWGS